MFYWIVIIFLGFETCLLAREMESVQASLTQVDGIYSFTTDETHSGFNFTLDHALDAHWHVLIGAVWDRLQLTEIAESLPETLQFAAAKIDLEYQVDGDSVFSLSFQPGLYGDQELSNGAFDMPIILEVSYPLNDQLRLKLGFYYSQLSGTNWLPVIGLVADFKPHWELDLMFPDSKLKYRLDDEMSFSLYGELLNNTYLLSDGRAVEYYQTHVGFSWEYDLPTGWNVCAKTGWALNRNLGFYQQGNTTHRASTPFLELGLMKKW